MIVFHQKLPKRIVLGILVLLFISCKSGKVVTNGTINKNISSKAVIKTHYQNELDFKTLSGKMKVDYSDGSDNQGVSVSLRMQKDSAIWLSAPFGVVKAFITPNRVSFYNKLQNEYFDGDFTYLSNILGTEIDFKKLQNVLLGQALFNLKDEKYDLTFVDENYQLKPRKMEVLFKTLFQIEPKNFKIATQQLSQPLKNRLLDINYQNYQKIDKWVLPNEILITAKDRDKTNTIGIEYRNIEFDKPLNFPYKIPKGFDEIILKKDDI